jgi:hypothetical protein
MMIGLRAQAGLLLLRLTPNSLSQEAPIDDLSPEQIEESQQEMLHAMPETGSRGSKALRTTAHVL